MKDRPNIVVCMCDQLRWCAVGCYGNPVIQTPNIDRLASEGLRFDTAITPRPVCMAARSSLLSGQYSRMCTHGLGNFSLGSGGASQMPEYPMPGRTHLKDVTLAETLKDSGYQTAAIGKWHINVWPHLIGFDHYVIPRVHHCHSGQAFTMNGGVEFVPDQWSVDYESQQVAEYLEKQKSSDEPFFLYYNISPPHCPVSDAPRRYREMYRPEEIPIRPNVDLSTPLKDQEHWFKVYRWDFRYYQHHLPETETLPDDYDLRHLIAEYYGMTTWVDDTVGVLLANIDAAGLAGDTIVLFTSDHGDNLGSHGLVQKGSPNDESIRVPMVVRGGKNTAIQRGGVVNTQQVASLVDLSPTLLDLAGCSIPQSMHGQNLAPVWRGEASCTTQPHAFVETGGKGIAIRTTTHQYALPFADKQHIALAGEPSQFFDMADDPYQLNNLAGRGEQAAKAAELHDLLVCWDNTTPRSPEFGST